MKTTLATLALLLFTVTGAFSQANNNEEEINPRLWDARFANGGNYVVKLDRISFASKHEYIGNGTARVVEVTIGTDTSVVARFYFFEAAGKDSPIAAGNIIIGRAEQLAKETASRVSPTAGKLNVVKDYPNTTHSHTVEFALQNEATLNSLYGSLMNSIHSGRGRIWRETATAAAK